MKKSKNKSKSKNKNESKSEVANPLVMIKEKSATDQNQRSKFERKYWLYHKVMAIPDINSSGQSFSTRSWVDYGFNLTKDEYNEISNDPNSEKWFKFSMVFYNALSVEKEEQIDVPGALNGQFKLCQREDGTYYCISRTIAVIVWDEPFELANFPFDVQALHMLHRISNYRQHDEMKMSGGFSAQFTDLNGEFDVLKDSIHVSGGGDRHGPLATLVIYGKRNWQFYFWRIIFVLTIVTFSGVLTFLFDAIEDQLAYLSTIILTTVAYLYIVGGYLPVVKYTTLLDKYIYWSIGFAALLILQVAIMQMGVDHEAFEVGMKERYRMLLINVLLHSAVIFVFGIYARIAYIKEVSKIPPPLEVKPCPPETTAVTVCDRYDNNSQQHNFSAIAF